MRILIADDDPISRRVLARTLQHWEYQVIECADGVQAWMALEESGAPRIAILDWMMPGMTGPEVCGKVRREGGGRYTYLILLTACSSMRELVEGLESGADDYLTKPFHVQELQVRLRAGRRIIDLESELVAAREALREQATRDPLTWVWNRYAILDILQRELDRGGREGTPVSVILVDLDHFKQINDRWGHLAGDAVLRETARRMEASVRSYDAVGRYGGEEFLIVLAGLGPSGTAELAERLRCAIADQRVATGEGSVTVTASAGFAVRQAGTAGTPEALIDAADRALYKAKAKGRNRVEHAGNNFDTTLAEPAVAP